MMPMRVLSLVVLAALAEPLTYPKAPKGSDADVLHGVTVPDPYRSLEAESDARTAFTAAQESLLRSYLRQHATPALTARMRELVDYDAVRSPIKAGANYFYKKGRSVSASAHDSLVMRPLGGGNERVLVEPDATSGMVAGTFAISPDGAVVSYVQSKPGVAGGTLRFLRVPDGQHLPTAIALPNGLAGPIVWAPAATGIYYAVLERDGTESTSAFGRKRLIHQPLHGPARQLAVFEASELLSYAVTADGRYLVITSQIGADPHALVTYQPLDGAGRAIALVPERKAAYTFLGGRGDSLWFYTDDQAPKGRVVAVDVGDGAAKWRPIVAETAEAISARDQTGGNALGMFGDHLVLTYVRHGQPVLRIFSLDGRPTATVELPSGGSIWSGFSGQAGDHEVLFWFLGLTEPSTIYKLDLRTGAKSVVHRAQLPVETSSIVVTQEFYTSWDGTRIPIFLAHRKGLKRDGRSPALIYGYGALGWVSFIWYQPHVVAWIEQGGVYAQPSIRGGGEYGEAWHHAALKTRKMTAVRDYVAAGEWLVQQKIAAPDRLVGNGGSLSAPLASAAARLKPGLFRALIIDRPVTDMIRFEKFTGGGYWRPEFGSTAVEQEFRSLLEISPYHRALERACMPATLVMSQEHDRTSPLLHGLKLTAALQDNQSCDNPILFKLMKGSGHNFGSTVDQQVDAYTDLIAFLRRVSG